MAHVLDLPESLLVLGPRHVVLELLHRWERGMGVGGEPRNGSQGWGPGRRPSTSASWPSYHRRGRFSCDNAVWPRGRKTEDTVSVRQLERLLLLGTLSASRTRAASLTSRSPFCPGEAKCDRGNNSTGSNNTNTMNVTNAKLALGRAGGSGLPCQVAESSEPPNELASTCFFI